MLRPVDTRLAGHFASSVSLESRGKYSRPNLPHKIPYDSIPENELDAVMQRLVAPLGVECVDALAVTRDHPCPVLRSWGLKP